MKILLVEASFLWWAALKNLEEKKNPKLNAVFVKRNPAVLTGIPAYNVNIHLGHGKSCSQSCMSCLFHIANLTTAFCAMDGFKQ
jgi:hypothetical protein